MAEWKYYNTLGKEATTSTTINLCKGNGPMSFCTAVSISDQEGCKYRIKATRAEHCMFWREDMNGACDNSYAQKGVDPPKE